MAGRVRSSPVGFPIDGVRVGHWTDTRAATGCTVLCFPEGSVGSGEIRGGAPATREFDLLAPERTVERIDAVVLTGGSAFGLAAADGVVDHLAEAGVGYPTSAGPVPIVVAMALYDLAQGDGSLRPGPEEGRTAARACDKNLDGEVPVGRVGAGTGATVGTWRGWDHARPGGLGLGVVTRRDLIVAALFAVNSAGDPDDGSATAAVAAGAFDAWPEAGATPLQGRDNTTLGVVVTNARLSKAECLLVAQSGHDGLARALFPAHTRFDGDAVVAVSTCACEVGDGAVDTIRVLATVAAEQAIRRAC